MTLLAARRHPWLMLSSIAAGVVVALLFFTLIPPTYLSTSVINVSVAPDSARQNLFDSTDFIQQRATTYAAITSNPAFAEDVANRVPGDGTPVITATTQPGTSLLNISATGATPQLAQQASAVATDLLIVQAAPLDTGSDGSQTVKLTVVEAANLPTSQDQPIAWTFMIVGLIVGVAAGLGLVLLRRRTHSDVQIGSDLYELGSDAGAVFRLPERRWNAMISGPRYVDYAERLAAVHQEFMAMPDRNGRILLLAAPTQTHVEAAHQVSEDLGATLLWGGRRVVVLRLTGDEDREHRPGLSEVLVGSHTVHEVIFRDLSGRRDVGPGQHILRLLTATEREIRVVMNQLLAVADVVIIDAPPLSAPVGFPVMSQIADAVLLVATAKAARADELKSALSVIKRLRVRYLGLVLAPSEPLACELPSSVPSRQGDRADPQSFIAVARKPPVSSDDGPQKSNSAAGE